MCECVRVSVHVVFLFFFVGNTGKIKNVLVVVIACSITWARKLLYRVGRTAKEEGCPNSYATFLHSLPLLGYSRVQACDIKLHKNVTLLRVRWQLRTITHTCYIFELLYMSESHDMWQVNSELASMNTTKLWLRLARKWGCSTGNKGNWTVIRKGNIKCVWLWHVCVYE